MGLYENCRAECARKHTSIMQLEQKLGFARGSIRKWNTNMPGIGKVKAVADELGVPVEAIIAGVDLPAGRKHHEP